MIKHAPDDLRPLIQTDGLQSHVDPLASSLCSAYVVTMPMHKQMVSLTLPQVSFLKKEAKRLGISVSELIRRIVDRHRLG